MDQSLEQEIALARATPDCQFGRYLILSLLGKGGMGKVHRAWDPTLEREVAIKVIHGSAAQVDPVAMDRFLLEARATARLNHTNIVQVYEVGQHEDNPYIVMDLVPGRHLLQHIREGVSRDKILGFIAEVARGLDHAHSQGIIHRDLKPENIVIHEEHGRPLLMDFGLAVDVLSDAKLTAEGMVVGTPAYMAPEQAHGGEVGAPADVYGLGAVLYRAVCGHPPFDGKSPMSTMVKVVNEPVIPPGKVCSDLPDSLEAIILRCLKKKPERRYASAAALAEDLERFLSTGTSAAAAEAQAPPEPPRVVASKNQAPSAEREPLGRAAGKQQGRAVGRPSAGSGRLRLLLGGPVLAVVAFVVSVWGFHVLTRKAPVPEPPAMVETKSATIWSPKAGLILAEAKVLVEGRLDAGDLEEVWLAGKALPVTAGSLEFSGEVPLPDRDGLCELVVSADPDGERELGRVAVEVDRTKPDISLAVLAGDPETRLVVQAGKPVLLSDPKIHLEGEVVETNLDKVSVSVGRGPLERIPLSQAGRFEVTLDTKLEDEGRATVEVIARDQAGNEALRELALTLDLSPPTVDFSEPPPPEVTSQDVVRLHGWVRDRHPRQLLVDGEPIELSPDGAFEVQVRLEAENQPRDVVLLAEDDVGRLSVEHRRRFVLDRTPPSLELESQSAAVTSAATLEVRGLARDAHGVALVQVDGIGVAVDEQHGFLAVAPLVEGQNRIVVAAVDVAGNREERELLATRDSTGPVITLDSDIPEEVARKRRLRVSGTVDEDGCSVLLNGDVLKVEGRAFSVRYPLTEGENIIVIEASDALGNRSRLDRTVLCGRRRAEEAKKAEQTGFKVAIYDIQRTANAIPDLSALTPRAHATIAVLDFDRREDFESDKLPGLDDARHFALRIDAMFEAPVTGNYIFTLSSDDGSRLWIDETEVVDNDGPHGDRARDNTVRLTKGKRRRLRVEFFQGDGGASLKLYVTPPGQIRRLIRFNLSPGDGS